MKLLKRFVSLFIDRSLTKPKILSPLEREKRDVFLMLFPF